MIKFLSAMLVLAFGFQAAADDLKIFRRAALGDIGIGRKGYIHCERVENGVRVIRVGRDGVKRNPNGDHFVLRSDENKLFVESKFKKKMADTITEDRVILDSDFIRNKYLKARDICDDHKALQSGNQLVRSKESGQSDDSRDQHQDQDEPAAPEQPDAPAAPTPGTPDND